METVRAGLWQGDFGEKIPLFPTGFSLSLGLHLALVLLFLLRGWGSWNRPPEQVIYSLTIESGSQKGRISQMPVKEDSQKAPPKPVQRTVAPPVEKAQPKEVKP